MSIRKIKFIDKNYTRRLRLIFLRLLKYEFVRNILNYSRISYETVSARTLIF